MLDRQLPSIRQLSQVFDDDGGSENEDAEEEDDYQYQYGWKRNKDTLTKARAYQGKEK